MDIRIRHIIIAFLAGGLFHKFLTYSIKVFMDRPSALGGEILFIPLMILLVMLGWEIRGVFEWVEEVHEYDAED